MPVVVLPPSSTRKFLRNLNSCKYAPQDEQRIAEAISVIKTRYQEIFDSPAAYVSNIRLHLYPEYVGTDGVLDRFHEFTYWMQVQKLEAHLDILPVLVDHGLLAVIFNFALEPEFWELYDEGKMGYKELAKFLSCTGYLLRCANPSTAAVFITKLYEERATQVVSLIRTLWQRRHDFLADPNYRPSGCVRQSLNDGFGLGIIAFTTVLEEFCIAQQLTLFDLSFELEPLILYCWSQTYSSPEETSASGLLFRLLQVIGSGRSGDPDWGTNGLKMLLTDPGDARDLVKICLWSLRKGIVDQALVGMLTLMMPIIQCCPDNVYIQMKPYWSQMLVSITRAGERQSCQGMNPAHEDVIAPILSLLIYLLRPGAPAAAFNLQGRGTLASVDLLPLISRYGPFAVLDDSTNHYHNQVIAVLMLLRSEAIRCTRVQDTRMLQRLHKSASTRVSAALSAINKVSSIDPSVAERKRALTSAWRSYAAALGIHNPMLVEAVEPSNLCPWEVCAWKACICHDKRAGHRLRVCKGCWQVYYCHKKCQDADWTDGNHRSFCRQMRAATGVDSP